jgi:hypothetical protein
MNQDYLMVRLVLSYIVPAIVVLTMGVPIVRLLVRRLEPRPMPPTALNGIEERLARIESAVDTIAVEVERISEAQRFSVRLQAESAGHRLPGGAGPGTPKA